MCHVKYEQGSLMVKRILAVVGSPRKNGNTHILVSKIAEGARAKNAEVDDLAAGFRCFLEHFVRTIINSSLAEPFYIQFFLSHSFTEFNHSFLGKRKTVVNKNKLFKSLTYKILQFLWCFQQIWVSKHVLQIFDNYKNYIYVRIREKIVY